MAIEDAIDACAVFLVALTPHIRASPYVQKECIFAELCGKKIVPLRLEDTPKPPLPLVALQHIDFVVDFAQGLAECRFLVPNSSTSLTDFRSWSCSPTLPRCVSPLPRPLQQPPVLVVAPPQEPHGSLAHHSQSVCPASASSVDATTASHGFLSRTHAVEAASCTAIRRPAPRAAAGAQPSV